MNEMPRSTGLTPEVRTPAWAGHDIGEHITEEAAITAPPGDTLRVEMLAEEDAVVAAGAPVARLRDAPAIVLTAPMAARIARVSLRAGRRLSEIVLFRETGGDVQSHDIGAAAEGSDEALLSLLMASGFWPRLRRRPFGRIPPPGERPVAIFVMATDTRPLAPDPILALAEREEDFARGLAALAAVAQEGIFVCQPTGASLPGRDREKVRIVSTTGRHPQGLAGVRIHAACPADPERAVWELHAEDVADLGVLLAEGHLPQTRLVTVAGPALTETRRLRCQIGADMRALTYGAIHPGPHRILSGSALDGRPGHWLAPRDRQVTVLHGEEAAPKPHWFLAALTRWSLPRPVIPTAALDAAAGGAFPVMAMIRALSVGDDETAIRLGALSLIEEDLALIDYVTGGRPHVSDLLREMLNRVEAEVAG